MSVLNSIPKPLEDQLFRFLRLFVIALVPQVLTLQGQHVDRSLVLAAIVGAVEVAFRALYPAGVAGIVSPPAPAPAPPASQ